MLFLYLRDLKIIVNYGLISSFKVDIVHKIYIGNNQEIDISEVSHLDISQTSWSDTIIINFKDYSNKELHYEARYERDQDLQTLQSAYNEYNYLDNEDKEPYEGETLL